MAIRKRPLENGSFREVIVIDGLIRIITIIRYLSMAILISRIYIVKEVRDSWTLKREWQMWE